MDTSHLVALHERLHREKARLSDAKSASEVEIRTVWVAQLECEVAREMEFLGMQADTSDISDDDLLAELEIN